MPVNPRARAIINHCQKPHAFLRAAHVKYGSGREFFLEPGSERVKTECAEEAIRSGWLIARDGGLFGDDPQTWGYRPKPAAQHDSTNTHSEPPAHGSKLAFQRTGAAEKTTMVDAREYFGVTFITLKDLTEGPLQAVIDRVEVGKFQKLNLIFSDGTALGLNASNARTLTKAWGHNTDAWVTLTVELSAGELEYQGKMQPAILVTPVSQAFTPAQKVAAAGGPTPARNVSMDDDIPF